MFGYIRETEILKKDFELTRLNKANEDLKNKNIDLKEELEAKEKEYKKLIDNAFTMKDVDLILGNRLDFLDNRIKEFQNNNVHELAKQTFIQKQEIMDIWLIFKQIFDAKDEKEKEKIADSIKESLIHGFKI